MHFADDLAATIATAEHRLQRLLARLDRTAAGLKHCVPMERVPGIRRDALATTLDLAAEGITSVVWATGFRRDYTLLDEPVLDAAGEIVHAGGVTEAPGLYVLGLDFMRRRNSSFIADAGDDAVELTPNVQAHLAAQPRQAA